MCAAVEQEPIHIPVGIHQVLAHGSLRRFDGLIGRWWRGWSARRGVLEAIQAEIIQRAGHPALIRRTSEVKDWQNAAWNSNGGPRGI